MNAAVNLMSVVPVYNTPGKSTDLVSQLLFGECVKVLDNRNHWLLVSDLQDNQLGWLHEDMLRTLNDEEYEQLTGKPLFYSADLVQLLENKTRRSGFLIPFGSHLFSNENKEFDLLGDEYLFHGNTVGKEGIQSDDIVKHAFMFENSPYLWGGKTPLGIDCSGFVQIIYKLAGMALPHNAEAQALKGQHISFLEESLPGDLVFFDNEEGEIVHVGILLNSENVIHAFRYVRINRLDHHGIFDQYNKKYTHKLRLIKRLLWE
ncbi:MAG: NlpC/P60 family protein [Bacteroidota bacterium]